MASHTEYPIVEVIERRKLYKFWDAEYEDAVNISMRAPISEAIEILISAHTKVAQKRQDHYTKQRIQQALGLL